MGRVRTKTVKKSSRQVIERYYSRMTLDFHTNKKILEEVAIIPSKRLRNKIAGFSTHLMRRIQRILYPRVWNPGGWYEEQFDAQADLRLAMPRISESLFDALLRRRIAQLKDDGLFHAVPTATQDRLVICSRTALHLSHLLPTRHDMRAAPATRALFAPPV